MKKGFTFVEVIVAMFVLVLLVLLGSAFVQRGLSDTLTQKYKRVAIEAANVQMEKVVHDLVYSNVFAWVGSHQATNIWLNGISGFAMTTTVVNAGSGGDECLKIKVSVEYRKSGDTVDLETYRSK